MTDKLLVHPKPFEDESLSNYLFRISQENRCDIMWILYPYEKNREKIYQELNACTNDALLCHISEIMGVSENDIKNMTLGALGYKSSEFFENKVFLKESSKFCPLCLKGNNYQKIFWQIKFINICMEHNTFLLNRCSCGKNITLENVILGECNCGKKLSEIQPEFNKYSVALYTQIKIYKAFNLSKALKHIECSNTNMQYINFSKEKLLALTDIIEQISDVASNMFYNDIYNSSKHPNFFFLQLNSNVSSKKTN